MAVAAEAARVVGSAAEVQRLLPADVNPKLRQQLTDAMGEVWLFSRATTSRQLLPAQSQP